MTDKIVEQPNPVRAELVEAPFFFRDVPAEEGQPFDKLRANGVRAGV
ncbi:MAG: hypothetical protein K2W81_01950 [Sphingomonas sp.]|nr:hypothetical protein [Sphingomonas sp.]MBY0282710.1 hypothetical protein [Sphingomonas sp.]